MIGTWSQIESILKGAMFLRGLYYQHNPLIPNALWVVSDQIEALSPQRGQCFPIPSLKVVSKDNQIRRTYDVGVGSGGGRENDGQEPSARKQNQGLIKNVSHPRIWNLKIASQWGFGIASDQECRVTSFLPFPNDLVYCADLVHFPSVSVWVFVGGGWEGW